MAVLKYSSNTGKIYDIDDADEIHRGGEGRIMTLKQFPDKVAKLYHQGIKPISIEKFDYLKQTDKTVFVVPEELLFLNGIVAGFIMSFVSKDFFPLSALFSRNFCLRNNISEEIKLKIAENLLKSLVTAHKNKLIIGDFNQYNVLVNNKGELKFIDTDSYECPGHKHSGIMLEEIRDYLYSGMVSVNSDFFALSVLLFYMFTYTHPFKGIHKTYKNLADRMIQKLPVFLNSPDIIPPKVYIPLQDKNLLTQFEYLYIKGMRFLVSLTTDTKISPAVSHIKTIRTDKKELIITPVIENADIIDIYFLLEKGYIETKENFIVFDTRNKSYVTKMLTIPKSEFSNIYLGNENILAFSDNKIYKYTTQTDIKELTNISLGKNTFVHNYEDILTILDEDILYHVYLKDITGNNIRIKRNSVLGKSFSGHTGFFQNIGGHGRILYNSGKDLTDVRFDINIKEIKQMYNAGIVKYTDNNILHTKYFKISGMKTVLSNNDIDENYDFAFMPTGNYEGIIFEPGNSEIKLIRTNDFAQISSLECEQITGFSKLQYAQSGIIAWEGKNIYLINKKS